jgi:cytidine deaminase
MKRIEKTSIVDVFESEKELTAADRTLLQMAANNARQAYAPYSAFHVGCALVLANGEFITGSNQENMAYPSGLCAERVAVFYAGAKFPGVAIDTIAISAYSEKFEVNEPVTSCGACLQSMSEYEMRQETPIRFILRGQTGKIYIAQGVSQFLPFMFKQDKLKNK